MTLDWQVPIAFEWMDEDIVCFPWPLKHHKPEKCAKCEENWLDHVLNTSRYVDAYDGKKHVISKLYQFIDPGGSRHVWVTLCLGKPSPADTPRLRDAIIKNCFRGYAQCKLVPIAKVKEVVK